MCRHCHFGLGIGKNVRCYVWIEVADPARELRPFPKTNLPPLQVWQCVERVSFPAQVSLPQVACPSPPFFLPTLADFEFSSPGLLLAHDPYPTPESPGSAQPESFKCRVSQTESLE